MLFVASQWISSTLTAQVSLAYSRTLQIQALYACPLLFSEMPIFLSTGSKLRKFFQGALTVCCCFKAATCLTNGRLLGQWNHLNNRRSLQTYHFQLSFLDHLRIFSWYSQYRHYTGKMDLPLTSLWSLSISCELSGYSFGRRLH